MNYCRQLVCSIVLLASCSLISVAQQSPHPGFSVTTTSAKGGKLVISAEGTVNLPPTFDIIAAELRLSPSAGGTAPSPVIIVDYGNGTWKLKDETVKTAGTYDVYAVFTFKKKNPQAGDASFDVASAPITGIAVQP